MTRTRITLSASLLLTSALLGGCAGTDLKAATAGRVECAPAEIEIIDEELVPGTQRWRARCRGKEYSCTIDSAQTSATCREGR